MPRYCCVPRCKSRVGGVKFPTDKALKDKWIVAIKRLESDDKGSKLWQPSEGSIVCHHHFLPTDYKQTLTGSRKKLRNDVVPSIFSFTPSSENNHKTMERNERASRRRIKFDLESAANPYDIANEVVISSNDVSYSASPNRGGQDTEILNVDESVHELNMWPHRQEIDNFMPNGFRYSFPSTRVILDATETPIEKPSNVFSQSAAFSTYKHKNTLKTMIGITPREIVSYTSESYGGSASDRQIIERSKLCSQSTAFFKSDDSIMADRGIMVQDLLATKNIKVNTPTMLNGKSQLEPEEVVHDRRVASKRIHVERVIGLSKTFQILKKELPLGKVNMGSRIIFVSFMISNFRPTIVSNYA
ncbi:uncharacterized protein LOC141906549 [Tubulanus polymorphus]|uniref:uncharacterized protein LOC141906549 n=1 Tax=Tubulanus polymorphus TaxID=672921 RepID=UPI003DA42522